jgi:3-deoxy-D-manno-octulosonic-acid transferase
VDRPVWVAGSTHEGEEAAVLAAHRRVRAAHPHALLVLVPRHPARFATVAAALARERVALMRYSQGGDCDARTEVLLVDTLGELLACYAAADLAFVGGSLVAVGGHNLLEPAALARPILTGPHNFNGADTARALAAAGAARIVADGADLAQQVDVLLSDQALRAGMGAAGAAFVAANRGALQRLLDLMEPLLG